MERRKEERGNQTCTGFRSQPTGSNSESAGKNRLSLLPGLYSWRFLFPADSPADEMAQEFGRETADRPAGE